MQSLQMWVVCEQTGRWAAALRVELSRQAADYAKPRLLETRGFAELEAAVREHTPSLVLVEVCPGTAVTALGLLAKFATSYTRCIALLEFGDQPIANRELTTDALLEAGALEVITSSRQLRAILQIGRLVATAGHKRGDGDSGESIAERAWAALPWQGA